MKISINTGSGKDEVEVNIICNTITPEIEQIISMLRIMDLQITGSYEGETFILDAAKVLYIDTADKKTFLYTSERIYETGLSLYKLEERLAEADFFRSGKSCIINFKHIRSLHAELDGRILVTLSNGEKLYVSRQYAAYIKKKLERKKS